MASSSAQKIGAGSQERMEQAEDRSRKADGPDHPGVCRGEGDE